MALIERVSVGFGGAQSNGYSSFASLSADGRYVAFSSEASNLVAGDTNSYGDVFVYDRQTGTTTRVSLASDGTQGNRASFGTTSISADGRFVAFASDATNFTADTNNSGDIFLHDMLTGASRRMSVAYNGAQRSGGQDPSLSADGKVIAFTGGSLNYAQADASQPSTTPPNVYVKNVDRPASIQRASAPSGGVGGYGFSFSPTLSGDGRFVAFTTFDAGLVPNDTNQESDVLLHDVAANTTIRVSVSANGTQANAGSDAPSLSSDGRYLAFRSRASNLIENDANGTFDIFLRDNQTGAIKSVSVATDGTQANDTSFSPSISADGRYVVFWSFASNLVAGDTNGSADVFVHDTQTGVTRRLSAAADGTQGNSDSFDAKISADGKFVSFSSFASNLVVGDTGETDVFVVSLENHTPLAAPDSGFISRGTTARFGASLLLANDSDPDGDALAVTAVGGASANSAVALDGSTVTFSATSDAGSASAGFSYSVSDGQATVDAAVTLSLVTTTEAADKITAATEPSQFSFIDGKGGNDILTGGAGRDTLLGGAGTDKLTGLGGDDTLIGGGDKDLLYGGAGSDLLQGGDGDDTLDGGTGSDVMEGGAGNDIYYVDVFNGDTVFDTSGIDKVISSASFTLAIGNGIENLEMRKNADGTLSNNNGTLTGNELDNAILGSDGINTLKGGAGNDRIVGYGGNDRIEGNTGRDTLTGGDDADTFYFNTGDTFATANGFDTITDFVTAVDVINLDTITQLGGGLSPEAYGEGQVTNSNSFAAAQTKANQLLADGTHRVVFVAGTVDGWLFWDTDGVATTAEAAIRLQGLNSLAALTSTDII